MEPTGAPVDNGARRLLGNAAWLLIGQLVSKLASVAFLVIVARAIGVTEYGYFTFATAFVPLFLVFGTLGVDTAVVREIARERERLSEVFVSGLWLRLGLGGAALVLSLALAPLFLDSGLAVLTVLVVGTALFLDEMSSYVSTVFKAFERMRFHASALVVNRIASTLLAVVAYATGAGLVAVCAAYFAGSIGALVYATVALRRHFPPVALSAARRATAGQLLRIGAPLGVAAVLNMALFRLDVVMVQAMEGPRDVGLYGVAFRFFESFLFFTWILANLTFPRISRQGEGRSSARTLEVSTAVALAGYLPLAVGALFVSRWAVSTLFGERYVDAAEAVPWLTLALVLYGITYQVRTASMALGGGKAIAGIAAVALATNVPLNLVLIPVYGFTGAAMATAAVSGLETLLTILAARRLSLVRRPPRLLAVPVVAAAAMGATLALAGLDGGVEAAVGALVYLLALVAAGVLIAPAQLREARDLLRKKPASSAAEQT